MSDKELKACPFCGCGVGMHTSEQDCDYGCWVMNCCSCYGSMETATKDKAKAIAAWNTRHDPDKDMLVEALEKVMSYTKLGTGSISRIRGVAGKALAQIKEKK